MLHIIEPSFVFISKVIKHLSLVGLSNVCVINFKGVQEKAVSGDFASSFTRVAAVTEERSG